MADGPNRQTLLALALSVVRPAADLARRLRVEGVEGVRTKSTETDVVTAADRAVERQVVAALRAARPQDAVLGEEFGTTDGEAGRAPVRWILDPIDGTVNYLYGIEHYAVSLAAEVDGEIVVGVVRNAATGREWTAIRGEGAFRDHQRLRCSTQAVLGQAMIATGFGYDKARRAHQGQVVAALLPQVRDIRRFGAASLDLCAAAEGRIDAYYEQGLGPWDLAAGGLIASEAGLRVSGLNGRQAGASMVLAAPEGLYRQLHDRLVELGADEGP